jgi:hypothetical protein
MDQSLFISMPYISGVAITHPEPLSRYLPQIPDGVISTWLNKNISKGSWILDPFGASPRLTVEAARAGFRLLVTANNPIARFLLEMVSNPPKADDLKSALAELAASYKADERMEPHIRSLYNTRCARCGQIVSADAFIWEHGNPTPFLRIYTCPYCGDSGEHACTPYDAELASQFSSGGLHKARALERVVASSDQDRIHVEQALSVYMPRALYALITIINKIEGLNISSIGQKHLAVLLLNAFDQGNAMWRDPGSRERRRQLTIPRHFRENNIWLALEQGIDLWCSGDNPETDPIVPITTWPEVPPVSGGICVYEGRLVSIADSFSSVNIKAVCAAIPRPNQAFWTLSALWAGWLWGREAVGSFKGVLHRQRYDWGWHTSALSSVFKQLVNLLDPSISILGLISEAEPGFIASVLVAAEIAGCGIQGIAVLPEEDQAQIVWRCKNNTEITQNDASLIESGVISARIYLESRGEPASYLNTISAAFLNIIQLLPSRIDQTIGEKKSISETHIKISDQSAQNEPTPSLVYSKVYNSAREALSYRSGFLRFNLQDLSKVESSAKNQVIQDTFLSPNIEKANTDEDESVETELLTSEGELLSEKERPTRSSDISESTLLWLRETENVNHLCTTDRYELTLMDYLITHSGSSIEEVNMMMCEKFPGLYTPDPEFIRICLESYGEKTPIDENRWQIRQEDKPNVRIIDIGGAHRYIHQIAKRLGILYTDHRSNGIITSISWMDDIGDFDYYFFPMITATVGEIVLFSEQRPSKGFIVIPGSRANLVIYKLQRDPRLSKAFNPAQGNWRFLKFRHLKSLAENPLLNRDNLDQLLILDPLTYSTPQLRLI